MRSFDGCFGEVFVESCDESCHDGLHDFDTNIYLKKSYLKIVMTGKHCSKCKSIKAMEHFEKGEGEYYKTCDVCRRSRQRQYDEKKMKQIEKEEKKEPAKKCNANVV